jgi:hypothetical protein
MKYELMQVCKLCNFNHIKNNPADFQRAFYRGEAKLVRVLDVFDRALHSVGKHFGKDFDFFLTKKF